MQEVETKLFHSSMTLFSRLVFLSARRNWIQIQSILRLRHWQAPNWMPFVSRAKIRVSTQIKISENRQGSCRRNTCECDRALAMGLNPASSSEDGWNSAHHAFYGGFDSRTKCLGRMNTNHGSPNHFKQCCGEFPNRWRVEEAKDNLSILDSQCDLPTTVLETNAARGRKSTTRALKSAALMVLSMLSAPVKHFSIDAFLTLFWSNKWQCLYKTAKENHSFWWLQSLIAHAIIDHGLWKWKYSYFWLYIFIMFYCEKNGQ